VIKFLLREVSEARTSWEQDKGLSPSPVISRNLERPEASLDILN